MPADSTQPETPRPSIASPPGTLIDSAYYAADASSNPALVTFQHYTEMQHIEERLTQNQIDTRQRPLVPGFKLLHRIGKGAYGTVWEAHSNDCDEEHVAIKFFTCSQWEPMHREVSRIARLEGCSGVMPFKQYADKKADPPYYVMPHARNGSLADLLETKGPLSVDEALPIFTRIVETMAFVHAKGVIHCDLKPANILMNESGEPLVADFGQAQIGSHDAGSFGTLFYMPPEQAIETKSLPDANWDVYALGAMLFEMLTGQRARSNETISRKLLQSRDVRARLAVYRQELASLPRVDLQRAVKQAAPALAHKVDARLAAIVESCLAIDPKERPRSAGQLRERLLERTRWKRQRSTLAAAATVSGLLLLLLAGFGIYSASKIFEKSRQTRIDILDRGLGRQARIAARLVETMMQDRVECSLQVAEDLPQSPIGQNLDRIQALYRERPLEADAAIPPDLRRECADWLVREAREHMSWYQSDPNSRAMGVHIVVDGRSFLLCQLKADGQADDDASRPDWHERFRMNWAWRDYYSATGNHFEERGTDVRREPIGDCHISQVYKSMAIGNPLRIDVASPVKDASGKTIALIISAIDLEKDLLEWLGNPKNIADAEEILIINDRCCWVSHPQSPQETLGTSDPQPAYASLDWVASPQVGMTIYKDPIGGDTENRAAYVPIAPFNVPLLKDKPRLQDKRWTVVVQMSDKNIDGPLASIRTSIYGLGGMALLLITGLLVLLWMWWIRTLRRQELLAHG